VNVTPNIALHRNRNSGAALAVAAGERGRSASSFVATTCGCMCKLGCERKLNYV